MKKIKHLRSKINAFIKKRPLLSFFISLFILFLFIILASVIGRPAEQAIENTITPIEVSVYRIGQSSALKAQGKVEKSGVTTIAAQTSGIVRRVNVAEGQAINRSQALVNLATTYSGANLPGAQLSLAKAQLDFQKETQAAQTEIIETQKQIANKSADNSEELRLISANSLSGSREQLNLTNDIISALDQNLKSLEENNSGGENDALILSTKQLKSQYLGAKNQLTQAINLTEYQTDLTKPAQELNPLSRDLTLKQLELQEKSLALNQEIAQINYSIAAIGASLMNPTSPGKGIVEQVHIRPGQLVSPGMPLVTLSGLTDSAKIVVSLPIETAKRINRAEPAQLSVNGQTFSLPISHLGTVALEDQLARVVLEIPAPAFPEINDQEFHTVSLPLGFADTSSVVPNIPIDTVHQTQENAFVFLAENNQAVTRSIVIGPVMGDLVEVKSGLTLGDQIITDRFITEGDQVTVSQ